MRLVAGGRWLCSPVGFQNPVTADEVNGWTVGSLRLQIECRCGRSAVVVTSVFVERSAEVSFAKDEHAVRYLAAHGEDEPLAHAFACGLRGGTLQTVMPASASTASKVSVNWLARSRMRTSNLSARSTRSVSRFLVQCLSFGLSLVRG